MRLERKARTRTNLKGLEHKVKESGLIASRNCVVSYWAVWKRSWSRERDRKEEASFINIQRVLLT